jgi:POT family proton-dependent oligopeptide transporter
VTFGAILLTLGHFGMSFEGNGSKQMLDYEGAQYQIALDARGGDAKQQIISDSGISYVTFTETDMLIADAEAVGLPKSISRDEFSMSVETEETYLNILYLSLALLIAGVGFLKANISTIVGSLYGFGDSRRDSGFTIFYMGINMGAFLASIFCGYLGIVHGWKYGFGLAGIGMLIGLIVFLSFQDWLEGKAEPPSVEKLKEKVFLFINVEWMCYLVGVAIIAVSMFLVMNEELVGGILGPIGVIMMVGLVGYSFIKLVGEERSRMLAAIYFILAQIPFWALFEQAGSSLNLFTARLVDRTIFGWSVPGPVFQSLNAGYIFLFAPLVAWLWIWLAKRNLNPSTPVKFALGVAMAGLGFLALVAGMEGSGAVGLTPVIFIFIIYWIHTMGELMVSPVGLSAVTKLAPARIVGMTMGAWFLYSGLSNFLAGVIARTTGAETIGGQMTNVAAAKAGYIEVYSQVGYIALGISVVMLLVSPVIKKMMQGAD